jgi:hypothetical protein
MAVALFRGMQELPKPHQCGLGMPNIEREIHTDVAILRWVPVRIPIDHVLDRHQRQL